MKAASMPGRLAVARAIWAGLALLILALSSAGLPVMYRQARIVCQSAECPSFEFATLNQPATEEVKLLAQLGFSTEHYALYQMSFFFLSSLITFTVASILIRYRADEPMALFMAFAFLLWSLVYPLAGYEVLPPQLHRPFDVFILAPYEVAWLLMFFLFPDGRFRPRWLAVVAIGWAFQTMASAAFPSTFLNELRWPTWLQFVFNTVVFGIAAVYGQIHKYRHTSNLRSRQQVRWVVFALIGVLVVAFGAFGLSSTSLFRQPGLPRLLAYPLFMFIVIAVYLAFAISILRYHLWDIELVVQRAVVYALLTAILTLIYFGSVVLFQQILRPLIGNESTLAIVLSTLAIAGLFAPLRRRIQTFIDRRFFRQKYDAQRTISDFGSTLRHEVTLETITGALLTVIERTVQPRELSLWLKDLDRERDVSE